MGAGASGQGGFARPRKACWRVFAARRKQALRGGRVRPPGLCLSVAHPRYRGSRAFPRRRGLAGHAPMPTRGGRPSGARAISRPFLGGGGIFSRLTNRSVHADTSCFFNTVYSDPPISFRSSRSHAKSTDSVPATCARRSGPGQNEVVVAGMPAARAWLVGRNGARGAHGNRPRDGLRPSNFGRNKRTEKTTIFNLFTLGV